MIGVTSELGTNDNEQPRRCRTFDLNYYSNINVLRQRRRRWKPLDGALRSADSLDEPLEGGATGRSASGFSSTSSWGWIEENDGIHEDF